VTHGAAPPTTLRRPLSGNGLNGPRSGAVVNAQVWIPNLNTRTISLFTSSGSGAGSPLSGNGLDAPEGTTPVGTQVWVANTNANAVSLVNQNGTPTTPAGRVQ
jgi:DNA-binding beta-propeller fold protein YncE